MRKADETPMCKAHAAPRCTATSKRSGQLCEEPAVRGWTVCRFHGAGGGHPPGPAHPSWRHGGRTREAEAVRKAVNGIARARRDLLLSPSADG